MLSHSLFFPFKRLVQKKIHHNFYQSLLIVCIIFLTSSCSSWLQPTLQQEIVDIKAGEYTLDKDHAALLFKINHMGFSNYVGRFNDFDVSLDFDPNKIENSRVEAVIDINSIDVNNPSFAEILSGSAWLDTQNFPQAVFRSLSVEKIDNQQMLVNGELTFLGVSKAVSMNVKLNGAANNPLNRKYTLGFAANLRFKRSDFGLKKFIPVVGDEVFIEIHSEFQRQ
jgi:polyisoprenoid-binding protein YceI